MAASNTSLGSWRTNQTERKARGVNFECIKYSDTKNEIITYLINNMDLLGEDVVSLACETINVLCRRADQALDQAFVAGVLSSGQDGPEERCAPTAESIQYHSKLPEVEKSRALRKAHSHN